MLLTQILFWLLFVLTGISALGVVVTQNIVRAAAWLLFTLAGVAGIFFLLGADFVGATQLIVYVGGTLVLVVFGVMLTAQGPFINMRVGAAEWAISTTVGLLFFAVLSYSLYTAFTRPTPGAAAPADQPPPLALGAAAGPIAAKEAPPPPYKPPALAGSPVLGAALLGVDKASPEANVTNMSGNTRARTKVSYLLPFEIVSVHLLVVLIGAAYLARAKRRRGAAS
jgi:NADH-quinone oxidoreductase subunit J